MFFVKSCGIFREVAQKFVRRFVCKARLFCRGFRGGLKICYKKCHLPIRLVFKGSCKEGTPKTQRVLPDRIELETVVTAIAVMSCMSCDVSFASDGRLPPPKTSRPARGSVTELDFDGILYPSFFRGFM